MQPPPLRFVLFVAGSDDAGLAAALGHDADALTLDLEEPQMPMTPAATDDIDGLRGFATELRDLGYYGMMLGDPTHIRTAHEIFSPTDAEVEYWRTLIALGDEAERTGGGPVLHGDPNQGEARRARRARGLRPAQPRVDRRAPRSLGMIAP